MRISDWSSDVCSSDLPGRASARQTKGKGWCAWTSPSIDRGTEGDGAGLAAGNVAERDADPRAIVIARVGIGRVGERAAAKRDRALGVAGVRRNIVADRKAADRSAARDGGDEIGRAHV